MEETATKRVLWIALAFWVLCFCCAAAGETAPQHTNAHRTEERARSSVAFRNTDSPDTHDVVTIYDLYCLDCQKVVQEAVRQETAQASHEWSVVIREPTCSEEGEEKRKCGLCGMEMAAVLPKANHTFVGASQLIGYGVGAVRGSGAYADRTVGRVITAPTCAENGSGVLVCVVCGGAEQSVSIPALGHDWGPWEDVQTPGEAVCETDVRMARKCRICGQEETRVVSAAPGHQWQEAGLEEPTCTEKGIRVFVCAVCGAEKTEEVPALGHLFAGAEQLRNQEAGAVVKGSGENAGLTIGRVSKPSTCAETGIGVLVCLRCQDAEAVVLIPVGDHRFTPWEEKAKTPEEICVTDTVRVRRCQDCGLEETETVASAPGHKWAAVSFEEPTCTQPGRAVRQCVVCKKEEVIEALPLGHSFMWVDKSTPTPTVNGVREYVCTTCGYVAESQNVSYAQMYYNNTIASFGPMTRELIGGTVWNRVTPIDLTQTGVFSYPLVASNLYAVGTATVVVDEDALTVTYRLNSSKITVHSESLVFYPNLESLRTGLDAVPSAFGVPVDPARAFGEDSLVIMAIALRADYDARGNGIQDFRPDKELIQKMVELID